MKKQNEKINFLKKIYYALLKSKKYGELSKEGLKNSIQYIFDLLLIFSIIYSGILTVQMKNNANKLKSYLEQNLPEFTYQENVLTCKQEQKIILDDNLVKANFGGKIVIDTKTDYSILVNELKNNKEPAILITTDKFTTVNNNGDISENTYKDIIKKYLGQDVNVLDKVELLYLFDNISYTYYFFTYALSYIIAHSILIFIFDLILTIIAFIICKAIKLQMKFLEIYNMGLYSLTITIFIYFAMNFLPISIRFYVQIVGTMLPIMYLIRAIYINKWITPEMVK